MKIALNLVGAEALENLATHIRTSSQTLAESYNQLAVEIFAECGGTGIMADFFEREQLQVQQAITQLSDIEEGIAILLLGTAQRIREYIETASSAETEPQSNISSISAVVQNPSNVYTYHWAGERSPDSDKYRVDNHSNNAFPKYVQLSIQSIRRSLDLNTGDTTVYQLGGSYGRIRRVLTSSRISGYEVHHIPSKAVVKRWGSIYSLPAIALLKEDHIKTDSYRYKSRKKYESSLPDVTDTSSYMDQAKERIEIAQLFELIRIELLGIRDQCGHRYDGAISQYLDVLEEYILKHGYPKT